MFAYIQNKTQARRDFREQVADRVAAKVIRLGLGAEATDPNNTTLTRTLYATLAPAAAAEIRSEIKAQRTLATAA